jgi:hypothetical protein
MQKPNVIWPDKTSLSNLLASNACTGRLKGYRDLPCSQAGVTAKLVEFHHKFLDRPYRDARSDKQGSGSYELQVILDD